MEENKNLTAPPFIMDHEKELQSCDSISEKNSVALHQLANKITSHVTTTLGTRMKQDIFDKFVYIKKENVIQKTTDMIKKSEMIALTGAVKKKQKIVGGLEKELKEITAEYEKLKLEIEKEEKENHTNYKIFKKALKYYTTYFQFTIEEGTIDEKDKFCAIITFILEGKLSKHPIQFVFDKQIDSLISFNAGDLLNEKQHEMLHRHYKECNNYPALFCALREAAIRKHKL